MNFIAAEAYEVRYDQTPAPHVYCKPLKHTLVTCSVDLCDHALRRRGQRRRYIQVVRNTNILQCDFEHRRRKFILVLRAELFPSVWRLKPLMHKSWISYTIW